MEMALDNNGVIRIPLTKVFTDVDQDEEDYDVAEDEELFLAQIQEDAETTIDAKRGNVSVTLSNCHNVAYEGTIYLGSGDKP